MLVTTSAVFPTPVRMKLNCCITNSPDDAGELQCSRQTSECSIDSGRCRPHCSAPSTVIDLSCSLPNQGCQLDVPATSAELVYTFYRQFISNFAYRISLDVHYTQARIPYWPSTDIIVFICMLFNGLLVSQASPYIASKN
jgi:hypothetical protein